MAMDPHEVVEIARIFHTIAYKTVLLISNVKSPQVLLEEMVQSYPVGGLVLHHHPCVEILYKFFQFTEEEGNSMGGIHTEFTQRMFDHLNKLSPTVHGVQFQAFGQRGPTVLTSAAKAIPFLIAIASVAITVAPKLDCSDAEFDWRRWTISYLHFCFIILQPSRNDGRFRLKSASDFVTSPQSDVLYAYRKATLANGTQGPTTFNALGLSRRQAPQLRLSLLKLHAIQFGKLKPDVRCAICGWRSHSAYYLHGHWLKTHAAHPEFCLYWPETCTFCGIDIPHCGHKYHEQFCYGYGGLGTADLVEASYSVYGKIIFRINGPGVSIWRKLEDADNILLNNTKERSNTLFGDERVLFILESFNTRMCFVTPSKAPDRVTYERVHQKLINLATEKKGTGINRAANVAPLAIWMGLPGLVRRLLGQGDLGESDAEAWFRRYKVVCLMALQKVFGPTHGHPADAIFPFCWIFPCHGHQAYQTPAELTAHMRCCHNDWVPMYTITAPVMQEPGHSYPSAQELGFIRNQ
ncbi:hypothetical protein TWF106_006433 [Orbilia oligospora]|uniref:Uncharacterized protein n=1 Tax=Orbilia oligospora TaxID=2813651 RepID=A0A7C8QNY5_ORBOL|nr:hypothetical protein TWF106_006433 [Orbilia oligospora]